MRRLRWTTALLAPLLLGACPRTDRDTPLPWHGALTRVVWADLAAGRYPMPRCGVMGGRGPAPAPGAIAQLMNQLTTSESFNCVSLSRDSLHQYGILGQDGAVDHYSTIVYEPPVAESRLDSLYQALSAQYGPAQRCRTSYFLSSEPAIGAEWRGPGFWVFLYPGVAGRGLDSHHWYRALLVEYRVMEYAGCAAADRVADDGRPLGAPLASRAPRS